MALDSARARLANRWRATKTWSAAQGAKLRSRLDPAGHHFARAPWTKIGLWTGGVLGAVIVGLVLFLTFADWNALRGPISRFASNASGREVQILGNLDVNPWSFTPEISVAGLSIGNPERFNDRGAFAEIAGADVRVRILPLFIGRLDIVQLNMRDANLSLYRSANGDSNWSRAPGAARGKPFNLPAIREFSLRNGQLNYVDEKRNIELSANFDTRESADRRDPGEFTLQGEGRINRQAFELDVRGAPLINVRRDRPYPFRGNIRAGATRIVADGRVDRPFDLSNWSADIQAQGSDLADLYQLTGLALPNTPPYNIRGAIERRGQTYGMPNLAGTVGDSDLNGHFTASRRNERLFFDGDFHSATLDFDDLMAVLGGSPDPGETASPEQRATAANLEATGRILPDARLDISRVRNMDARVSYRATRVRSDTLPLRALAVDVNLDRGLLQLDPLTLTLNQGRLGGAVALDAREDEPRVNLDMRLADARLDSMFVRNGRPAVTGTLAGRARLSGVGASVREAAANANGAVTLVIPRGEIREAFAELTGVNVTRGLGLLLTGDQSTIPIRCGIANFAVVNGQAQARAIVIDTETMLIRGQGSVSLRDETLGLQIQGEPKSPRLLRIAAPIQINGRLRAPEIGIEAGPLAGQTGIAAVLAAVVAPLAAILPFVDPGLAEDTNCAELLAGRPPPPREG